MDMAARSVVRSPCRRAAPGAQVLTASITGNSLTYTGKTIVSEGTLRLAANDRIPDAAATNNVVVGDSAAAPSWTSMVIMTPSMVCTAPLPERFTAMAAISVVLPIRSSP